MGSTTLKGTQNNDSLKGGSKDDILEGLFGDDTLSGGSGDDLLNGGEGDDILNGGSGDDQLNGDLGDDQLSGGSGDDHLNGDLGDDILNGGSGDDLLNGGEGDDILNGGSGDDLLNGGEGDDQLIGYNPDATEFNNPEIDSLTGGSGVNTFWVGDSNRNYYGAEGRYAIISDFDNPESVDNRIQLWGGEEYEYEEVSLDGTSGLGIFGAGDSPLVVLEGFDASDASSLIASDEGALTFIEYS